MAYRWMIAIVAALIILLGMIVAIVFVYYGLPGHEALAERIEELGGVVRLEEVSALRGPQIVYLSLAGTGLGDEEVPQFIPTGFVEEVDLRRLAIGKQTLEHLGRCRKLRRLILYCTDIADQDMRHLRNLSELEELDITFTAISDEGLNHLSDCQSLNFVRAMETYVTEKGAKSLQTRLPNAYLEHSTVPSEEVRKTLMRLSREGPQVQVWMTPPSDLPDKEPLTYSAMHVDLRVNRETAIERLKIIAAARPLNIRLHNCSPEELSSLAAVSGIMALEIRSPEIRDEDLKELTSLAGLQELSLRSCPITDNGLATICELSTIRSLCLMDTLSTDAGLAKLRKLDNLKTLYLIGGEFTDAGILSVSKVSSLEELQLSQCEITDAGLEQLKSLPKLRLLHLRTCSNLTNAALKHLESFSSLEELFVDSDCPGISREVIESFKEARPDVDVPAIRIQGF